MSGTKNDSHWIPLADLMTVLMVIFLFMSISYMALVEKKQKEQNQIFKDYEESKVELYNELNQAFKDDFAKWDEVLIRSYGERKFITMDNFCK